MRDLRFGDVIEWESFGEPARWMVIDGSNKSNPIATWVGGSGKDDLWADGSTHKLGDVDVPNVRLLTEKEE